jgi:hypothetical protein
LRYIERDHHALRDEMARRAASFRRASA